jgi:xylulokinase
MILGLDIGSSSVKAALLLNDRVIGRIQRAPFPTRFDGLRAEIDPPEILRAIQRAIHEIGPRAKKIDAIALSVMAPAWVAMDKRGNPITPIVTHQDRRAVVEAGEIEGRIGRKKHLSIAGVRPIPGGISSTTWEWFRKHRASLLKRADLIGHLNTFLIRAWTGQRVVDPSNATFMGVYSTCDQSGWSNELCDNVSMQRSLLPAILQSNQIAGRLTREAASELNLPSGVAAVCGMIDTSAAMLQTGGRVGQLVNTCGSTDVLALCTDRFHPHERLITRALGVERKWMSVSTLAAAGSAIVWAHDQLFPDLSWKQFDGLVKRISKEKRETGVRFDPYLAGDRMSIEQPTASFTGLTLSTTREQLLGAIIDSLATDSAARLPLLAKTGTKMLRGVVSTGRGFDHILRRDWPGRWTFQYEDEASLRGLARLI